jgi:hypothetical protein
VAALQSAVQAYKQEEELAGNIVVKSVKRRREPAQVPMVMIICLSDKAHTCREVSIFYLQPGIQLILLYI